MLTSSPDRHSHETHLLPEVSITEQQLTAVAGLEVMLLYGAPASERWTEHAHDTHQLIITPENKTECEFSWRNLDGKIKTIGLTGQQIFYIRKDIRHALQWYQKAAIICLNINDDLMMRLTMGNLCDDVKIRSWWDAIRHDIFIWNIVEVICGIREQAEPSPHPRYLEALGTVLATHLLTQETRRRSDKVSGLTPLQLRRVQTYIENHFREPISVDTLARETGLGKDHFINLFKISTGLTPYRFILAKRIQYAQYLFKTSKRSIAEISVEAGFFDQSHLGRCLKRFCQRLD